MTIGKTLLLSWHELIWNWMWPQYCVLCGGECETGGRLCPGCARDLPKIGRACPRCARLVGGTSVLPSADQGTPGGGLECGDCQVMPPPFEASFVPYRYAPPMDQLVREFKFDGRLEIGPLLAELLYAEIPTGRQPDLLIPVPLHARRLNERGFNQSLELTRKLHRLAAVPCDFTLLVRTRPTAQQTTLDQSARRSNVAGAFAARGRLDGKRVALIDDVVTTGATVGEAAKVLLGAGARSVEVWAVARSP